MEIFKDAGAHLILQEDLKVVGPAFENVKSRLAEKGLEILIECIVEDMHLNLTNEAAEAVAKLSNSHPDSDVGDLINFLAWKNAAKVESAKEFKLRVPDIAQDIDEDVVCQVRVYPGDFYIEVVDGGENPDVHCLTLENQSWSEPETTLEAMELELFEFSQVAGG